MILFSLTESNCGLTISIRVYPHNRIGVIYAKDDSHHLVGDASPYAAERWGGYFSIGIAPDTAFKAYTVNEGKAAESPAKDYFRIGGNLDAAIGYSFNDWLGLGLSTGVNYGKTAFNYSQGVLTVPFMAQLVSDLLSILPHIAVSLRMELLLTQDT